MILFLLQPSSSSSPPIAYGHRYQAVAHACNRPSPIHARTAFCDDDGYDDGDGDDDSRFRNEIFSFQKTYAANSYDDISLKKSSSRRCCYSTADSNLSSSGREGAQSLLADDRSVRGPIGNSLGPVLCSSKAQESNLSVSSAEPSMNPSYR